MTEIQQVGGSIETSSAEAAKLDASVIAKFKELNTMVEAKAKLSQQNQSLSAEVQRVKDDNERERALLANLMAIRYVCA